MVIGDGNRNHDYDYFYFADPSVETNSTPTAVLSARLRPFRTLELIGGYQAENTGSKVEYFPNYFADKHNDFAKLAGGATPGVGQHAPVSRVDPRRPWFGHTIT